MLIAFISTLPVFAVEDLPGGWYEIVSDEYSSELLENTVLVKGKAIDAISEYGIESAYIGNVSQKKYMYTKIDGEFRLEYNSTDSTLYFYHPNYGEVVIWNYDFKSQHVVTINFYSNQTPNTEFNFVEKPVIYLYSPRKISANIKLENEEIASFTYPQYLANGWSVTIDPDKGIVNGDRTYPYLFWEGRMDVKFKTTAKGMEGYFIQTDSTVLFLEKTLADYGLNSSESTDFITYWVPRMINYKFALVQFFVDSDYDEEISGLIVHPKPDAQRRIFMVFKGFNNDFIRPKLKEPVVEPFNREGFTLIEWGGSEIQSSL